MPDPFHPGEREIQHRTGERDRALRNGRLIADRIPAAATGFVSQQSWCVLGGAAADGDLWAAFLAGPPGFARTDEARTTLRLRLPDPDHPLTRLPPLAGLRPGGHLGVLFIELATRRRLRVNGRAARVEAGELVLAVEQAHPLCPKYIQRRLVREPAPGPPPPAVQSGEALDPERLAWIAGADTCFVASAHPDGAADVSHRGGRPGFIRLHEGLLRIPDYPGNSLFNTLGNFALHPRAGLTFLDFGTGRQLQLTGDVRLEFQADPADGETGDTGRWWTFRPRRWIVSPLNRPLTWNLVDASPFNP